MKKIAGRLFAAPNPGLLRQPAFDCPKTILAFLDSRKTVKRRDGLNKLIRMLFLSTVFVTASAWAQGPVYHVGVDGLACPFCAYGIEKQLQKLDGVKTVEVDVKEGNVVVTMHDGKALEKPQAEQAVKKAGFSLRSFDQTKETKP